MQFDYPMQNFKPFSILAFLLGLMVTSAFAQKATSVDQIDGLFYTVQIGTYTSPSLPSEFSGITELNIETIPGNRYRYSTGIFRDIKFARARREELLNDGVKGAFVIAYENGTRISLRDLRKRALDQPVETNNTSEEEPSLITLPKGTDGSKKFDFQLKSGDVLSEATREVSDLFENQILDYSQSATQIDTNKVYSLFNMTFDSLDASYYDSALFVAMAKKYRGDIGLGFNSWYIYNVEPGFGPNEDIFFKQRLNLTLDMDLLNNGFYANRMKAKRFENNAKIAQLKQQEISSISRYEDLYNYIIYIFNNQKLEAIDERINLLNRQIQIIEMLYSTKDKTWEELIELKGRISRAENMYNKWQNYNIVLRDRILVNNEFVADFDASQLPILDPIPSKMFTESLDSSDYFQQLIALEQENIDLKYKGLSNLTLKPFIRYNLIENETPVPGSDALVFDQSYASAGLIFRVPINFNGSNEVARYEKEKTEFSHMKKEKNDQHELLNYYYEYSFKLEQLVDFYYTRFRIEERLRREIIKYQFGDVSFSPLIAVNYMDELIANEIEIIDLKQNLYLKALKMSEYMNQPSPLTYSTTVDPGELLFKYQQRRSTYIWSKFFNAQDNLFLIHYLKNNEIKQVFLSPGPSPMTDKVMDFNKMSKKHNITSLALIGDNKLALEIDSAVLVDKLNNLLSMGFEGFHFDIEPQTFPDWEGNQQQYVQNISSVLKIAKSVIDTNRHKLSISLSLHYPEFALSTIYPLVDEVYLMAYERPDIEFIQRKSTEEFALNREKTTISVRTKDFPNRLVMEKFIELLDAELDLSRLAIHDLGTLFELDYQSSMNEK